jgi:hypothetical protein
MNLRSWLAGFFQTGGSAAPPFAFPEALGKQSTYFRVARETAAGMDVRAREIPLALVKQLEAKGKPVRPSRSDAFVSYWALMADGDFHTLDVIHDPSKARLTREDLETIFSAMPRAGISWTANGDFRIGSNHFTVYRAPDAPPEANATPEEVVFVLRGFWGQRYYYAGGFVS